MREITKMAKNKTAEKEDFVANETREMALPEERRVVTSPNVPDFMREETDFGLDGANQYISPPRMKVVQKQSGAPLSEMFDTGDVILMPNMLLVSKVKKNDNNKPAGEGHGFGLTPLFFFPEWLLINPMELKGSLPFIEQRSLDPNSPMVPRCRNKDLWLDPILDQTTGKQMVKEGKPMFRRYVEALNFLVMIVGDHPASGVPVLLSFSKGEHKSGGNLLTLLKLRKAPIFGCQFFAQTRHRPNNPKGDWYGIDVMNPPGDSGISPFVQDGEDYDAYKKMHKEFREHHSKNLIRVDYDDSEVTVDATVTPSEF